jgi:hypothetical protein
MKNKKRRIEGKPNQWSEEDNIFNLPQVLSFADDDHNLIDDAVFSRPEFRNLIRGLPLKVASIVCKSQFKEWQQGLKSGRLRNSARYATVIKSIEQYINEYLPNALYVQTGLIILKALAQATGEPVPQEAVAQWERVATLQASRPTLRLRPRGGKTPRIDLDGQVKILARYQELLTAYKDAKNFHNATYKTWKGGREAWQKMWNEIAKTRFPHLPIERLACLANPDHYISLPSTTAYKHLSLNTGYTATYLEKLNGKTRKILADSTRHSKKMIQRRVKK